MRAELAVLNAGPILRFFDPKGAVTAIVSANGYDIFGTKTMTVGTGQQSTQVPVARMNLLGFRASRVMVGFTCIKG
jgi:hypothetical protein